MLVHFLRVLAVLCLVEAALLVGGVVDDYSVHQYRVERIGTGEGMWRIEASPLDDGFYLDAPFAKGFASQAAPGDTLTVGTFMHRLSRGDRTVAVSLPRQSVWFALVISACLVPAVSLVDRGFAKKPVWVSSLLIVWSLACILYFVMPIVV